MIRSTLTNVAAAFGADRGRKILSRLGLPAKIVGASAGALLGKYGSVGYGANRTINKHVLDNISSPYPAAPHYRDYIDGEDTAWDYFEEGESLSETDHTDWDYYNEGEDQSAYAGQDQRLRDMTPGSAAHLAKP